jgi:ATP-binding cassette subfamily F protein uup
VLVFDEPTNDLDIETLELLEELIAEFEGTVLLVSHDRVFLDHIVTSTLAFEGNGRVTEYVGGWEDYLRQSTRSGALQRRANEPEAASGRGGKPPRSSQSSGTRRKLSYNEQRELESLPAHLEALEVEQQRLRTEVESPEFYRERADHIRAVLARLEQIGQELDTAMARWLELEDAG